MKILLLNHNVVGSPGTFWRAYHFGRELVRRGHQIDLVSISPSRRFGFDNEIRDGVNVVGAPDLFWGRGRTGWDPWDCGRRIGWVRGKTWDIAHGFDSRPAVILPALSVERRGTPLVLDWADWWGRGGTIDERSTGRLVRTCIGPVETWFEERFRTRARRTTVISTALERRALALGVPAEQIVRIPQGSDVESIRCGDRAAARNRLGLDPHAPLLVYLGTLLPRDRTLLFEAFASVRRQRRDVRLLLMGNSNVIGPDDGSIVKTGYVNEKDKLAYLAAANVALLPMADTIANRGRWPSKINDYLAAGRPIAATAVGDCQAILADYRVGVATRADAASFAAGIMQVLEDPSADEMGRQARAVAERVFAWPILAERLEQVYRSLTA